MTWFSILLSLFLIGCAAKTTDFITPQPTGSDKLDIHLQNWIESPNITYCEKYISEEDDIDGFFCVETLTDNRYYVPTEHWFKLELNLLFVRVSKHQLRKFSDKSNILKNYLCETNYDCSHIDKEVIPELQDFKYE